MIVQNETVYLFGMDYRHAYIEAFDLVDGEASFRFGTSY